MGLFTGKSVVVTGSAPHITESVQDLSGFDLVCRINGQIPLSEELEKATGPRCDVWYPANRFLKLHPDVCEFTPVIRTTRKGAGLVPDKYQHKVSYMNPHFGGLKKKLGCIPNRGLRAVVDILADKPKRLYVTGMTFFQTGVHYKGHYPYMELNPEAKGDEAGHLQAPQIAYFKSLMDKIEVDDVMKEVL